MKIIMICLFFLLTFFHLNGQNLDCNQLTKGDDRYVPKEVCIPYGFIISEIFECGDLNLDGLNDYVFSYTKIKPDDGDTTFVSIYFAKDDSTFVQYRIFENLYPIIFKRYDFSYTVKDSMLNEIQGRYNGTYPLRKIQFLDGVIKLEIKQARNELLSLNFVYNIEKNNWMLEETVFTVEYGAKADETKTRYSYDEQITIEEFNYFDWL